MAISLTSRSRCNSGRPRPSTRRSWRRRCYGPNRNKILRPAIATTRGSSQPTTASMPFGSLDALPMPVIRTRGRRPLMPPLSVTTGRRAPPPALTAWPIRNPSLERRRTGTGITRFFGRTRAPHVVDDPGARRRFGAWGGRRRHPPHARMGDIGSLAHNTRCETKEYTMHVLLLVLSTLYWVSLGDAQERPLQLPPVVVTGVP